MTPTNRDPIEEVLRRAAPDEPATLPSLAIDRVTAVPVRAATPPGSAARRPAGPWPLVVVGAIVLAVVTWQLAGLGASAPTSSSSPGPTPSIRSGPSAAAGGFETFHGGGISFDYPSGWQAHQTDSMSTMGSTIAIVGTVDLGGCGLLSVDINCAYAAQLRPGDVIVFVGTGASPGGSILEMAPPGGFREFVDGMPAVVTSSGPIPQNGQEAGRSWTIGMPLIENNWYVVQGNIRGPDVRALEARVDAVARSVRFDQPAPSLPTDPDAISAILRRGIDALDRNAREYSHSAMYACFPRAIGTSAPTTIEDGPGGPLPGPLTVTCGVAVEPTPIGLFAVTLSVHWDAGPGYAAGTYREVIDLDGQGALGAERTLTDSAFPATRPAVTPGPATTPIALEPGSLVEVLYPGVTFYREANRNDGLSDLPHGARLWIVGGPTIVDGEQWYRVQWQPTPTYDGIPGWMPATLDGHPVVAPAAPRCPSGAIDTVGLVGLIPAERLACLGGRDLTLGPVTLALRSNGTAQATGSPSWLAESATIAMYGPDGPDGVDGPLLVRPGPVLGTLPYGSWLEVTGHFDDPAAAGCVRGWTPDEADSISPETAAEQVLSCREQFVITAVRPVAAP